MDILTIRKLNPEFTNQVLRGVLLYQSGRREQARQLLAQAVLADPSNATAWLWLGRCLDDPRQKQECRERVRQLDKQRSRSVPGPHHEDSIEEPRRALSGVTGRDGTGRDSESVTYGETLGNRESILKGRVI